MTPIRYIIVLTAFLTACGDQTPVANNMVTARVAANVAAPPSPTPSPTIAPSPTPTPTTPTFARGDLIGAWADTPLACRGDTGISFNADGTYTTYGENGRWTLAGDALTFTALETDSMGERPPEPVANPTPMPHTVLTLTAKRLKYRSRKGEITSLVKCP